MSARAGRHRYAMVATVIALLATGCGALLGLEPLVFDDPAIDGGGGAESGTDGGGLDAPTDGPGRCSDGGCAATLLASGQGKVVHIAVDETSVFFTAFDRGTLGRVAKSGGTPDFLLPEAGLREPTAGLVIDDGFVYASAYTAGSGDGARRVPLDGGAVESIDTCNTAWSLSLDATDVFWLTGDCGGSARLKRRSKTVAGPAQVSEMDGPYYGYAQFGYQALDATDVYWTSSQHVKSLPKNAIDKATPRTVYERPTGSTDKFRSIAVADRIYAMLGGRIIAIEKGGGGDPAVLAQGFPAKESPAGLVIAGADLYLTVPEAGLVARIPTKGGTLEVIAQDQQMPSGLAVDATHVYWSNAADGTLWRAVR